MTNKQNASPTKHLNLLVDLYHLSKKTPPLFRVTPPKSLSPYRELALFKQQVEIEKIGFHDQPYHTHKKNVLTYQLIFMGLGALFLVLDAMIISQKMSWAYTIYFNNWFVGKSLLCVFCTCFSLASFAIGYSLRIEKEAVHYYYKKARQKLSQAYARKRIGFGFAALFGFGSQSRVLAELKSSYKEAKVKLSEYKEEALHLLDRIAYSPTLSQLEKERLFNQAILELKDKLNFFI